MRLKRGLLEAKYSCAVCGLKDAKCILPTRGETEGVVEWMDRSVARICADHEERSPGCRPQTLTEIKIPVPTNAERIGD